uniref:Reverse transcriptase zinc-binding domain-containing protein n=1 Tax=Lupinus angustifolius TaxID=3871 RepID=A0A3S7WLI3_LUPAN|nr:hypothetical protein [Lupinus angustifolius]
MTEFISPEGVGIQTVFTIGIVEALGTLTQSRLPVRLPPREFKAFFDGSDLIHLPTTGNPFIWSNRRRGLSLTEKRLDRSLCNEDWISAWSQISYCTLPRISSVHHPLLLCSELFKQQRLSQFKFHKMWTLHEDCIRTIAESWRNRVFGCPMFILAQKLKNLKQVLNVRYQWLQYT